VRTGPRAPYRPRTAWVITLVLTLVVGPPLLLFAVVFLAYVPIVKLPTFSDKQSDVNEALRFGSLVLPASANVLEVELDRHRDAYYSLKLTISPSDVDELIRLNDLADKPADYPFFDLRFAPELPHDASRDVLYFEDELPPQPENKEYVTRQIAVDRTDAQRPTVYIDLSER
jgi:hypothetical protein